MEIINPGKEDYHTHSITFSDGWNSIDEIVKFAGEIGLKKIAITDHCQFYLDRYGYGKRTHRGIIKRWENIFNDVEVIFGIECDIMNENGDISKDIQGFESDFLILSMHRPVYTGAPERITEAYLNAIEKHARSIKFLGHPCVSHFQTWIDIDQVIEAANKHEIPMEFNCANFVTNKTDMQNLAKMLEKAHRIYVNSDGHTLSELKNYREKGLAYLKEKGFL